MIKWRENSLIGSVMNLYTKLLYVNIFSFCFLIGIQSLACLVWKCRIYIQELLQIMNHSGIISYQRPNQCNHFRVIIIWCIGPFKASEWEEATLSRYRERYN